MVKRKKIDICLLQETYLTDEMSQKIKREWEGDILMNFGSSHSRGTAILLKNQCGIINSHSSADSRIQLINIKNSDEVITIVNIYAPNIASERKTFFF